ncbi:hypothetical protein ACO0K7_07185 [Undibacterium sp. Ji67W]|uniref:hypothetical protein n=1 Tax=Undibacterium sp. Ji67W TaxID=3413042 RepID=UPI003BEF96BD
MSKLSWRIAPVSELSQMLVTAHLEKSSAVGNATIYHFQHDGQEKMAVTLADGQALMIELQSQDTKRRRKIDGLHVPRTSPGEED